ncbi:MAG: tRNA uridine-5-carboxymethylaminomethyl(34) synthesis enzyme MnmG, partial [Alphaproteobacteria bacterium]|nr:tRNA uridine-5-carboxymethylaminomethyl(34) synthesis enzyme MnmG [Alphaproteobacteria bacterium]
ELSLTPKMADGFGIKVKQDGVRRSGKDLLSVRDISFADISRIWPELESVAPEIASQIEKDALYAHYIERQKGDVAALKRDEAHIIPEDFDFVGMSGLSGELKAKLAQVRPATLGQAGRIDGMTPAALTLILSKLYQKKRGKSA